MADTSFLPEDYLARQAERRTNALSLTLFVVVMAAVFGAFLVTNRQAAQIKVAQASINAQFKEAAVRIEELNQLEEQKERMLNKAEIAAALVERVPRSILLAELINRMPSRLSLQEFQLRSVAVKKAPPKQTSATSRLSERKSASERGKTKEEATEDRTVQAPEYTVDVVMVGVAATDLEISRYISELNAYPLLKDVTLKYSVQTTINDEQLREFRVEMRLDPRADVRNVKPLLVPRGWGAPTAGPARAATPDR